MYTPPFLEDIGIRFPRPFAYLKSLASSATPDSVSAWVVMVTSIVLNVATVMLVWAAIHNHNVSVDLGIVVGSLMTLSGYCFHVDSKPSDTSLVKKSDDNKV